VDDVVSELSSVHPPDILLRVVSDLIEKNLIVSSNDVDLERYARLFHEGMHRYAIQHVYFIPTKSCNFACEYCFVQRDDGSSARNNMTEDVARKALDVFARLTQDASDVSLVFYGGEPLLNAKVLYLAMRYVRTLEAAGSFKSPVRMTLLTNGALVGRETADVLAETDCEVSISLDGPRHVHDAGRRDIMGNGTFERAVKSYWLLKRAGIDPAISCTLHELNVEHIDEITTLIVELRPRGMSFNILLPTIGRAKHATYSYEHATKQLIEAFKVLRRHGIYEDRMMRRVRPYIEEGFHLKDCMGVGGQIVVTPDGRIGPCQAFIGFDDFFPLSVESLHQQLPNISSEDIYADPLFDEWRHRFPLNMSKCSYCFAIAVCGGGCAYAAHTDRGSIWEIDERVCCQAKQTLEWLVWDTYDHFRQEAGSIH
jgi:uncharacterized protein